MSFFSKLFEKKSSDFIDKEEFKKVAENLYKRNLELASKNSLLALLGKLYEISILSLAPKELSLKVCETIQETFSFEFASIYLYKGEESSLAPLAFLASERFHEIELEYNCALENVDLKIISNIHFFKKIFQDKTLGYTEDLKDIWDSTIPSGMVEKIKMEGHTKSAFMYPLFIGEKLIGAFMVGINRTRNDLVHDERVSIESFINVIAVALNKSMLYEELNITNTMLGTANDKLKVLDQQKSEFISVASHQLRAPLTAIKGYASMVLDGDFGELSDRVKEAVEIIFKSSHSLVSIVGDYLDISRIEQGKMKYDFVDFDLKELINTAIEEVQPTIGLEKLKLSFAFEKNQDYMLHGDQGKIKQVILNIIDNAIKYTKEGFIKVTLGREGNNLRVAVKDSGVGISPQVLPHLFEKFTRAPDASKTNILGTGLGLYVAKRMIEAHKGRVWAESEGDGKGSQFYVELEAMNKKDQKRAPLKVKEFAEDL